jgi:anaerobic dimethyl sulfoxide reductase subunit B (iron-sulfur subunit)
MALHFMIHVFSWKRLNNMKSGFIFDQNRCVACGACSASCVLENGWDFQPREIYKFNSDAIAGLPVINLSMACNHCETALCLEGCPTGAYSRNRTTGAVIIDELKCIGCLYCQWNCPFDAPKLNSEKKVINKCDLCSSSLSEGRSPACSTGCPTGALQYGNITENADNKAFTLLPDKALAPSIRITGTIDEKGPSVIPSGRFSDKSTLIAPQKKILNRDFSLVLFSFLTTVSVSIGCSALVSYNESELYIALSFIISAGLFSFLHLGSPLSAWRALINIKQSPLSREIALFGVYSIVLLSALIINLQTLIIVSAVTGVLLLIFIDNVYQYSDKRKYIFLHSGQAFLSGLIMISFLIEAPIPFLFIAVIKSVSVFYFLFAGKGRSFEISIRFLRLAFLLITAASFLTGVDTDHILITSLFLAGEFIDRLFFYFDFAPVSVNQLTTKTIKNK